MTLAAHAAVISTSTDDGGSDAYTEVDGLQNFDWAPVRAMLETTDFKDTSAGRTRMAGLKDGTITLSGDYESADTGQAKIPTAWAAGSALYFKFLPNGTTGFKVICIIQDWKLGAVVDGKITFAATVLLNGAYSAV